MTEDIRHFEIYVCPVCGETERHYYPSTTAPYYTHTHVDQNRREYHVQFVRAYPLDVIDSVEHLEHVEDFVDELMEILLAEHGEYHGLPSQAEEKRAKLAAVYALINKYFQGT